MNSFKISVKDWVAKTNAIGQELPQAERLPLLNTTAISQMKLLTEDQNIKQLKMENK